MSCMQHDLCVSIIVNFFAHFLLICSSAMQLTGKVVVDTVGGLENLPRKPLLFHHVQLPL